MAMRWKRFRMKARMPEKAPPVRKLRFEMKLTTPRPGPSGSASNSFQNAHR